MSDTAPAAPTKLHPAPRSNARNLDQALAFLDALIRRRLAERKGAPPPDEAPTLGFFDDGSPLGDFIRDRKPSFDEYALLALALAPEVRPGFLDAATRAGLDEAEGDFPELGCRRNADGRALVATGETAMFLLAGDDLDERFAVQRLLEPDHWFQRESVLALEAAREGEPHMSGRLVLGRDWLELLTTGRQTAPPFSAAFPAKRIETTLDWEDIVLAPAVREQLDELARWAAHRHALQEKWGLGGRVRPGYRALFHGPSGTGKTFAAALLGLRTGREVYRVDLSAVVSKYIGETEKNLAALFDVAQHRDWILFFDEADALFGKRTGVKDAHDRYANQEVSFLLQRVEDYGGLAILASNFRANIDDAFLRRFNAIVRFPQPDRAERREIWRRSLPGAMPAGDRDALAEALSDYELTGGNIVNVVQYAAIEAEAAGLSTLRLEDAVRGVRREMEKEGRVIR